MAMPYGYLPSPIWNPNSPPPTKPELALNPYVQNRLTAAFNQLNGTWGGGQYVQKVYDNDLSGTASVGDPVVLSQGHYGSGYWGVPSTVLSTITHQVASIAGLGGNPHWWG